MANCIFSPIVTESFLLSDLETVQPGPDGFSLLFHLSISSSIFPTIRNHSTPQKGVRVDVLNYRGISRLSSIPKTYERIIISRWFVLLSNINVLTFFC